MNARQATEEAARQYVERCPHLLEATDLRKALSSSQGLCGRFTPEVGGCRAFWFIPQEGIFDLCADDQEPYRAPADFEYMIECIASLVKEPVPQAKQLEMFG